MSEQSTADGIFIGKGGDARGAFVALFLLTA
jgi:hypothetical protein